MQNFATRVWERHYFQGSVNNGEDHVFLRFSEDLFGGLLPVSLARFISSCLFTHARFGRSLGALSADYPKHVLLRNVMTSIVVHGA